MSSGSHPVVSPASGVVTPAPVSVVSPASGVVSSGNQSVVSPVSPVSPAATLVSEHSIPSAVSLCDLICRHLASGEPLSTLRFEPSRPSVTAAAFSLTLPGSCIQAGFPADSKTGISSSPIVTSPSELQIYSVPVIDDGAPKYLPDEATDNPHVLVVKANITTEGSSPVRIVSHARNLNDVLVLDSLTGSAIPDPLGQVEVGASPPEFPTAQSLLLPVPISRSPLHDPAYPSCVIYEATKDSTNNLVSKDSATLPLADLQFNLLDLRATEYLQADDNFHLHGLSFGMPLLCAF